MSAPFANAAATERVRIALERIRANAQLVLAGRVDQTGPLFTFIYGQSYRTRPDAISLFVPELPLRPGVQEPAAGLAIAGVLRDGSLDRWGRGVIERRRGAAPNSLSEIDYMLSSSSNRFGALDFQVSREDYVARGDSATPDEGGELSASLGAALMQGTNLGGARRKATFTDSDGSEWLAKFASSDDQRSGHTFEQAMAFG